MAARACLSSVILQELCDNAIEDVCESSRAVMSNMLEMTFLANSNETTHVNPDAHVENYVEVTVPLYTPRQFKEHFRMDTEVFEVLCEWIGPHLLSERTVSIRKKLLATLWVLGNKESYRGVADRFGFSKGALHNVVTHVCHVLTSRGSDVIAWPQHHEMNMLARQWQAKAGIPGVVGAVDGSYIPIPGPNAEENRDSYICRKGFPAMHLQVVCSPDLRFLDVHTGNVGSVHDSRVFNNCDLKARLESQEGKLPTGFHLLGDSAYTLAEYMLVPFRNNGHLSNEEKAFNFAHSSTRVTVEHAIGLLKGKFRRLKHLDMTNVTEMSFFIFAACVLHNFIIKENGVDVEDIYVEDETGDDHDEPDGRGVPARSAVGKRCEIASSVLRGI